MAGHDDGTILQEHSSRESLRTESTSEPDAGDETEQKSSEGMCPVIGIGASAGGLEAFTQMLKALPPTTGMAYVLVQHLDPSHESMLVDLLAQHTSMPVRQAAQGTQVEPNHVYIIPPNSRMTIQDGILAPAREGFGILQMIKSFFAAGRSYGRPRHRPTPAEDEDALFIG